MMSPAYFFSMVVLFILQPDGDSRFEATRLIEVPQRIVTVGLSRRNVRKARAVLKAMDWFLKTLASEEFEAWLDILLLVVSFVYLIFAAFQWLAIRRQSKIAYQAVKVANEANEIAKQTLVISQRARISINNVSIGQAFPNPPVLTCKLANTGNKPAIGILTYAMWSEDHPSRVNDRTSQKIAEDPGYIMDPHSEEDLSIELTTPKQDKPAPLTEVEWQKILAGKFNPHIGICVSYFDGFGNACLSESWHLYNPLTNNWNRTYMRQT